MNANLPQLPSMQHKLIADRFSVGKLLGAGSFGQVYIGIDLKNDTKVALKLEPKDSKSPQLKFESKVYKDLGRSVGIPAIIWFGEHHEYYCLAMSLLGASLEDLFNLCNRKFNLKTTLILADQMISRIEYIHNKHYIHREY